MKKGKRKSKVKDSGHSAVPSSQAVGSGAFLTRKSWILPVLLLVAVHMVFFRSVLFEGKTFSSPDTMQVAAPSHQYREMYREEYHSDPRWIPHVFSGMPARGSMMIPASYPPHKILKAVLGGFYEPKVVHHLLGSIWMFLLLRVWGVGVVGAWIGGVSFSLSTYMVSITAADHGGKLYTASYIPLLLLTGRELLLKRSLLWMGGVVLAVGLILRAKHPQIAYYGLLALGLLAIFQLLSIWKRIGVAPAGKALLMAAIALVLGYMIAAPLVLPASEYAPSSIRGSGPGGGLAYDYATQWSFHPAESITFLVPGFFGFGGSYYWGRMPFTDAPNYFGVLVAALAVLGAASAIRTQAGRYLVLLVLISWVASLGKHFPLLYDIMFRYFPHFNKFRVPVLIQVLLQTGLVALAAFGIDALSRNVRGAATKWAFSVLLVGVLLLVVGSQGSSIAENASRPGEERLSVETTHSLQAKRAVLLSKDSTRSGVFLILSGALILGTTLILKRDNLLAFAVLLVCLLAFLDIWGVSSRLVHPRFHKDDVRRQLRPTPAEQWLTEQGGLFRVLPLGDKARTNRFMASGVSSVLGYYPAKMARYSTVLERRGIENLPVLKMLNTKFVLAPGPLSSPHVEKVGSFGSEHIYTLKGVLPRAWFVPRWTTGNKDDVLTQILSPGFRPDSLALLETDPGIRPAGTGRVISIDRPNAEMMDISVEVDDDALLVISEVYYEPGWRIHVDGEPAQILRADYLICAVPVPKGADTVTLFYESKAERIGSILSLGGWGVLLVILVVGVLSGGLPLRMRSSYHGFVRKLTRISHRPSVAALHLALPASLRSVGLLVVSQRIRLRGPRSQALQPQPTTPLRDESR